ncbi:hypothetical protein ACM0P6_04220 [Komagataeibacter sucrofermentans]|uniref:DUF3429 domain-containing protein n=1 Tax=Komagataeibacter sucrofermentans TaxID=1053551 RepID=A0A318QJL7_9PROT|nr:hypothetical protein [Komagataeibacter sucrofermentans]PYD77452.1 hypothetical protein CFR77_15245 [Komagataeibacter sucrofermentans]GBQ51020.1 hypothetical protein AA15973_2280 [Komagataeibacter sucrofermentans DSM 15973]
MTVRIHDGCEATATRTPLEGGLLGWAAVLMLGVCLVGVRMVPRPLVPFVLRFARMWVAGLFCFFGGVHRGASFYNPRGPQLSDPVIFLAMHFMGLGIMILSPQAAWRLATPGMLATLGGDLYLARGHRLPRFFLRLRPLQLMVASGLIALLGQTEQKQA